MGLGRLTASDDAPPRPHDTASIDAADTLFAAGVLTKSAVELDALRSMLAAIKSQRSGGGDGDGDQDSSLLSFEPYVHAPTRACACMHTTISPDVW